MRPDEHKRKKNTQYKKKHGIKTGNATEEQNKADNTKREAQRRDGKRGDQRNRERREPGSVAGPNRTTSKTNSDSSDSDQDGSSRSRELVYEKKSFSKRRIESNWAKYDLPVVSDTPESRGDDFSTLLASAGDAMAQFRFKDEQDWEDTDSPATDTSRVISLDCQSLASAVDCIPLYRRLGVDKDNFMESQVILQDLEAQRRLQLFQSGVQSDMDTTQTTQTCESRDTSKRKGQREISLSSLVKPSVALDFTQPGSKPEKAECLQVQDSTSVAKTDTSMDEDLDFLLSLDAPSQAQSPKSLESTKSEEKDNGRQSPEQREVAAATTQDKSSGSASSSVRSSKTGSANKEEDLEDWLDSMLDD